MNKEELKELLDDLPEEEYVDKLIEALTLWSRVKDELPDEEYLENVCYAASPATARVLDELPGEDYLDKVIEAGIPVYNYDNIVQSSGMKCAVTHDQIAMGRVMGEFVADFYESRGIHGKVYTCFGALTMRGTHLRHEGFLEALEGTDVEVIEGPDCQFADELCANAVMDAFGADPELNGVWSQGGMMQGAVEGLKNVKRLYPLEDPRHVGLFSINSDDNTVKLILDGLVTATIEQSPGKQIDYAIKAMLWDVVIGHAEFERETVIPSPAVDIEYLKKDMEADPHPTCWGLFMLQGYPYQNMMPYDLSPFIETPTVADRLEYAGY